MSALNVIIIGSSIAGLSAAESARTEAADCRITILSEDSYYPYYRQRLCEVLDNPEAAKKLFLHPEGWYAEKGFEMRLNTQVKDIFSASKEVLLADGEKLPYDKLIIASGSYSFIFPTPGSELEGVETMWTMADALRIEARLSQTRSAVVIGGGLLGLEAAYALVKRGIRTVVLERASRLMARQLDDRSAELFSAQVREVGTQITTNAIVSEIFSGAGGEVAGVRLEDGQEIEADLVIISTGVRARLEFLASSGIKVDRCIVVDEQMRTDIPDIWAAGDCACLDGRWYGLWTISKQQGSVAGANAAGASRTYEMSVPPYMVNTMGTRIASAGIIDEKALDVEAADLVSDISEDETERIYKKKIYVNGQLSGFVLLGDTKAFSALSKELSK